MRPSRLIPLIVIFFAALIILPNVIVTAQSFQLTIKVAKLNVRSGPSTRHAILGSVSRGDVVTAIGRSLDSKWYVIEFQSGQGWIINTKANYSTIGGVITTLPGFETPPLPSKSSGSKPTATIVVQSVVPQGGSCPSLSAKCTELRSCDEARACLAAGNTKLDRDHDGIPCESLCG